jgi:mRNA-degrading endonuclease RelE of RelBE toxin-antitoxin system
LAKVDEVLQTPTFKKAVKKLKPNQKKDLDKAIKEVMLDPFIGEQKQGNYIFYEYISLK